MISVSYLWAKLMQRLRGKAVISSEIDATAVINAGSQVVNSVIGKYSYCGYDCRIINCKIGNYCSLADQVIIGSAQHPMDWVSTSPVFEDTRNSGPRKRFSRFSLPASKQTTIGSDVWIGYGAIIKAGVIIGHGAVIGAGAVVTKDVEPYSVVGGCPAVHLKYRFDGDVRKQLLATKWWGLNDSEIGNIAKYITDPKKFISKCNKIYPGGGGKTLCNM